ncbi:MAG: glutamate mutase L [Anaerolineales bacterium]|nr:MAG: glutamate mutase L [Anaerolineales bacterium]
MSEGRPQISSSLVAIDLGSVNTRAQFFDAVEGRYRFIAAGEAATTAGAPTFDTNHGVLQALSQLQEITGRQLLNERGLLLAPDAEGNTGANALTATFSAGPPLRVITVGLLEGVSLHSVNNLVDSFHCEIVDSLSLGDRRSPEKVIDAVSKNLPDLIVVAGGTHRGASRSVVRLANYLALALKLLPESARPPILFVGNENLQSEIDALLAPLTKVYKAANIRPSLDQENPGPAEAAMSQLIYEVQAEKLGGLRLLNQLAETRLSHAAQAFGRTVRFLSTVIDAPKGMLGVDLGASSTTVASAFGGELEVRSFPNLGMGRGLAGMLAETQLQQITRWLPYDIPDEFVLDYLYNKPLLPQTLPSTPHELAIEMAAARQVVRLAIGKSLPMFPAHAIYPLMGTVPWFDRILVSGSTLTRHPRLEQSLLAVLDAVQPVGIVTIILDQNNLAASLGAAAAVDAVLAVQVLESNAFMNLGTVIVPVGSARTGSTVLRVQMVREGQKEEVVEIPEGGITMLPLAPGKAADLFVQPLQNMNIGLGAGRGGWIRRVVGGAFGLIFDTRGRPIQMPTGFNKRQELLQTWERTLTGGQ